VYLSHELAYVRLHPATIEGDRAQVTVVGLNDLGRRRVWTVRVSLSWDATRMDWIPYDRTRDVAAELWIAVETAARGTGWVLPRAEGPDRSAPAPTQ
jgi:hypothetical protein